MGWERGNTWLQCGMTRVGFAISVYLVLGTDACIDQVWALEIARRKKNSTQVLTKVYSYNKMLLNIYKDTILSFEIFILISWYCSFEIIIALIYKKKICIKIVINSSPKTYHAWQLMVYILRDRKIGLVMPLAAATEVPAPVSTVLAGWSVSLPLHQKVEIWEGSLKIQSTL